MAAPSTILDSWKQIATYLNRGVRTVQRWEREEALPVHRHQHSVRGTVWGLIPEVDEWWKTRSKRMPQFPHGYEDASLLSLLHWNVANGSLVRSRFAKRTAPHPSRHLDSLMGSFNRTCRTCEAHGKNLDGMASWHGEKHQAQLLRLSEAFLAQAARMRDMASDAKLVVKPEGVRAVLLQLERSASLCDREASMFRKIMKSAKLRHRLTLRNLAEACVAQAAAIRHHIKIAEEIFSAEEIENPPGNLI
jgi:hypothetical protein